VEDIAKEACDADGIYVVLRYQRWGKNLKYGWSSLENWVHSVKKWRAVCTASSGKLQIGEGVLFILCMNGIGHDFRNCVRMKLSHWGSEILWKMVGMDR